MIINVVDCLHCMSFPITYYDVLEIITFKIKPFLDSTYVFALFYKST